MKALQKGDGVLEQVDGVPVRHSNTSTGTGLDQEISHGFSGLPDRLELIPIDSGTIFSGLSVEAGHFHVTVTSGKNWGWIAEVW
jgi:hypothetical protein